MWKLSLNPFHLQFHLQNFKQIRNNLTDTAARMFLSSVILSRLEYCLTSWSFTGVTTLKAAESLYNKALKIFDKKPSTYHTCNILHKYDLLSFSHLVDFKRACLVYKTLHDLAPPPLKEFIKRSNTQSAARVTRAVVRGDCAVPYRRTTFGQTVLSVTGGKLWNSLPLTVRECPSYNSFKLELKDWLLSNQTCTHF